jgi:hypothetical protein
MESAETSEFGRGTLGVSRCFAAMMIGMFGLEFWNDRILIESSKSNVAACVWLLAVASLIALSWYLLGVLMRSSKRSLSFDSDGLWRTHLGKERGLVRWGDIYSVKESSSALVLFDQAGDLLLKVDYERQAYFRIRNRIMEGMWFQPPDLPLDVCLPGAKVSGWVRFAFACAALLCLPLGLLLTSAPHSHGFVTIFLCGAVLCGLLALPRLKTILAADGITIRGRTYLYSEIRSVDASFMPGYQPSPKLTLDVVGSKRVVILTRGLTIDSLTLQRTLLWAVARGEVGLSSRRDPISSIEQIPASHSMPSM